MALTRIGTMAFQLIFIKSLGRLISYALYPHFVPVFLGLPLIQPMNLRSLRLIIEAFKSWHIFGEVPNKAVQRDATAVSHLLPSTQKLRHGNCAPEQRRYVPQRPSSGGRLTRWLFR